MLIVVAAISVLIATLILPILQISGDSMTPTFSDGEIVLLQKSSKCDMRNGNVEKTVVLSDKNDWSYTWYAEDDDGTWTVSEKEIPDGYRVTVNKNETSFILTNTYGTPPDIPDTGDTANLMLYILIFAVAGIGLVLVGLKLKAE